jgi:regulatory protein YycI of two-component signal transduction system YycFG
MSDTKVIKETTKGVIAIIALLLVAFLYTKFLMNAEDESYERNREKIERIMEQNRLTNNNELIMGGM